MRRILEVFASLSEDLRDLLLALDDGAQAGVRRSEGTLHQDEDRVGYAARVVVRILLPVTDDLKREQLRADAVEKNVAISRHRSVQRICRNLLDLLLVDMKRGNLLLHTGSRVVLKLRVVLVQTGLCTVGGSEMEEDVGEVLIRDEAEGLHCAIGGDPLGGCGRWEHSNSKQGGEKGTNGHVSLLQAV